ncbi:hypothetical protein [Aquimarina celericrescens]|uniref:DUF4251 domain-containing protein n=1 Tax=Aquimarina celericrescens TaxID=1964542 RepID=A0ABW5AT95_9FLAO|nr:hypothetical protein [Aquimarina celericrescens]
MKKFIFIYSVASMLCLISYGQTVNVSYLNLTTNNGDPDNFLEFGIQPESKADFMGNNNSHSYNNVDDFSIYIHKNRDIILGTGLRNVIIFPNDSGKVDIETTNTNTNLQIGDGNHSGSPVVKVKKKKISLAPLNFSSSVWLFTTRGNEYYANLIINHSNNKTLTLKKDYNVGIGITNPIIKPTIK